MHGNHSTAIEPDGSAPGPTLSSLQQNADLLTNALTEASSRLMGAVAPLDGGSAGLHETDFAGEKAMGFPLNQLSRSLGHLHMLAHDIIQSIARLERVTLSNPK